MTRTTYRLVVEAELSDRAELAFGGMTITRAEGRTPLTGLVRDRAELQGLLQRVSDLGLTLLEASAIDDMQRLSAPRRMINQRRTSNGT